MPLGGWKADKGLYTEAFHTAEGSHTHTHTHTHTYTHTHTHTHTHHTHTPHTHTHTTHTHTHMHNIHVVHMAGTPITCTLTHMNASSLTLLNTIQKVTGYASDPSSGHTILQGGRGGGGGLRGVDRRQKESKEQGIGKIKKERYFLYNRSVGDYHYRIMFITHTDTSG